MARVLLDTHALLWWLADSGDLPASARALIADPETEASVSIASLWEIAIKVALGRLDAPAELPDVVTEEGFAWLAIEPAHAWAVRELPRHHRDPFDRLIIAQALVEGLDILTDDAQFADYGVKVLW